MGNWKCSICIAVPALFMSGIGYGQFDSIEYRQGIAVQNNDSTDFTPPDTSRINRVVNVAVSEIPDGVLKTLKKDVFTGWNNFPVYFEENTNLYRVIRKEGKTVYIYRIAKDGAITDVRVRTDN